MTAVLHTKYDLDQWLQQHNGTRAVVLTMGALHAGHASLMRAARTAAGANGTVMVTIFVNPTQFAPHEDFEKYPRTLESDVALCAAEGVDAVFAPTVDVVYPPDDHIATYEPGPLESELEGAVRPGHFAGVLQVVSRLLQLTQADITCFGEKDYQQFALVRRLASLEPALAHCRFLGVPTVRDADGLALSSRNRYLTPEERAAALAIPACLELMQSMAAAGATADHIAASGEEFLRLAPGVEADYVVIRDLDLGPAPSVGEGRALIAARVGSTRLLDNGPVSLKDVTA